MTIGAARPRNPRGVRLQIRPLRHVLPKLSTAYNPRLADSKEATKQTHAHALLAKLPSRPLIQKRLSELLRVDAVGTPLERGGRYFLSKKRAAGDLWNLYVRQGLNGSDEVLIDPHTLSADHTTDIELLDASDDDGALVVYGVRRGGVPPLQRACWPRPDPNRERPTSSRT